MNSSERSGRYFVSVSIHHIEPPMIRIFDILRPSDWPWHSFINLPLIPLALIFSRLTPISTSLSTGQSGKDLFPLLPDWPPPPFTLGLIIFPIIREVRTRKTDPPLPAPSQAQAVARTMVQDKPTTGMVPMTTIRTTTTSPGRGSCGREHDSCL
jgi:hypothetical protein